METNNLYRRLLYKSKRLTKEQEKHLLEKYKQSDDWFYKNKIADVLISSYRPFVYAQALKYSKNEEIIHDLISEGNIGILIALNHYDLNSDIIFLTFANYYITKYMLLYLNNVEYNIQEKNYIDDEEINISKYELNNAVYNIAINTINNDDLKQMLIKLFSLAHLTQLEIKMLKLHYGILNENCSITVYYTYKEISNMLNISEYKIKKSINNSLLKLKKLCQKIKDIH